MAAGVLPPLPNSPVPPAAGAVPEVAPPLPNRPSGGPVLLCVLPPLPNSPVPLVPVPNPDPDDPNPLLPVPNPPLAGFTNEPDPNPDVLGDPKPLPNPVVPDPAAGAVGVVDPKEDPC